MVPGYVAHPGQLEAAPPPLEVDGPIPDNNNHITRPRTSVFRKLLFICYIVWVVYLLVMQPKTPKFKVESATVQLNTEGSKLTAQWDITLLATNPNHNFKFYYKRVQADVRYALGSYFLFTLVEKPRPSFVLNKSNQTRVELKLSVWKEWLGQKVVEEISSREVVSFGVELSSQVWFMSRLMPPGRVWLVVSCDEVDFRFSWNNRTGKLTSQSGKCVVKYGMIYISECLVTSSFLFFVIWACCVCDSKPRRSARVAPS
ncbi:uncharacterized protein LOC112195099 [Rosa chinensis]|uniref:uncharacterized protein LOC112195099 n=1 Tax=Rosa chinensis TaxID=74649 RepID=UPI000D08A24C|nr:uncharacterized protein LOC112195099 [Rosa chinensis]